VQWDLTRADLWVVDLAAMRAVLKDLLWAALLAGETVGRWAGERAGRWAGEMVDPRAGSWAVERARQ
jgi:hypothetical protein